MHVFDDLNNLSLCLRRRSFHFLLGELVEGVHIFIKDHIAKVSIRRVIPYLTRPRILHIQVEERKTYGHCQYSNRYHD